MFLQASVILLTGGVSARGGVCSWGVSVPGDPPGMATAAGGTHPTEMYSCLLIKLTVHLPFHNAT